MAENETAKVKEKKPRKKHHILSNIIWYLLGFCTVPGIIAILVFLVPVSFYAQFFPGYVSDTVASQTLYNAIMNLSSYTVGDFPILTSALQSALSSSGMGDYFTIDYTALSAISFSSSDLGTEIQNCITVTATVDTLGVDLGDFYQLPCFSQWVEVGDDETVDTTAPKLYYYQADSKYARAFDDDGNYVEGVSETTTLYLANLRAINVLDMAEVLADRIQAEKAISLINVMGGIDSSSQLGTFLNSFLGDYSIGELGSIDYTTIKLSSFVSRTTENEELLNIVSEIVGKDYEQITIGDLTSGDISLDSIYLTSVLPYADNAKLYTILISALGVEKVLDESGVYSEELTADTITLTDFTNFNYANIRLVDVLDDNATNAKIYSILCEAAGVTSNDQITISTLSSGTFSFSGVKLTTILDIEDAENSTLLKVLSEASGGTTSAADLTVGNLQDSNIDLNNVKLSTVLGGTSAGSDNAIIQALIADETVTLGTLGEKINSMEVYDIFGGNVFTEDSAKAASVDSTSYKYSLDSSSGTDVFALDENGTYYVSDSASVWLLFCFDVVYDTDASVTAYDSQQLGRGYTYTASSLTYADLADGSSEGGTSLNSKLSSATLYDLILAGLIDDNGYSADLKKQTIQNIIDTLNSVYGAAA